MKSHTGYEIKKYFFGKPTPQEVQVSFSLDYHGWLKLEKSNEWLNFLEALASFQTNDKNDKFTISCHNKAVKKIILKKAEGGEIKCQQRTSNIQIYVRKWHGRI